MTLSDLRISHNITQKEIEKRTGIPYDTYRSYEYGRQFPKKDAIVKLAKLYHMSPGELLNLLIGVNNDSLPPINDKEETIMPALPMLSLSQPESLREFEYILREYCAETFKGPAQLYGRQGIMQNGVDIVVTRPDGTRVCVQCKDYRDSKIIVSDIDEWVKELNNTTCNMSEFVLATSLTKPNAKLQERVHQISDKRLEEGLCPVNIIFWNDIECFVYKHPDLLKRFWPPYQIIFEEMSKKPKIASGYAEAEIRTAYDLKKLFLDAFINCDIEGYLRQDPFVGFDFEYLKDIDSFIDIVSNLLDRAVSIANSNSYRQIVDFFEAFNDYNDYQSEICGISRNGKIVFLRPFEEYNLDEYRENVDGLRTRVDECFNKIKSVD